MALQRIYLQHYWKRCLVRSNFLQIPWRFPHSSNNRSASATIKQTEKPVLVSVSILKAQLIFLIPLSEERSTPRTTAALPGWCQLCSLPVPARGRFSTPSEGQRLFILRSSVALPRRTNLVCSLGISHAARPGDTEAIRRQPGRLPPQCPPVLPWPGRAQHPPCMLQHGAFTSQMKSLRTILGLGLPWLCLLSFAFVSQQVFIFTNLKL